MYGGLTDDATTTVEQGVVYVLTLPAFRWLKQSGTSAYGRSRHSCNIIGNRQMLVVGGLPVTLESGIDYTAPDPWPNGKLDLILPTLPIELEAANRTDIILGLGVFDMSEMKWASEYDPSAAPYITPDVVKEYYQDNDRYPRWTPKSDIEKWFTTDGKCLQKNHTYNR